MTWGVYAEQLQDISETANDPPPMTAGSDQVATIFGLLSGSRSFGFGMANPISLADMNAAFDIYGLKADTRIEYIFLLQKMDSVWLKHNAENMKRKAASNGNTKGSN